MKRTRITKIMGTAAGTVLWLGWWGATAASVSVVDSNRAGTTDPPLESCTGSEVLEAIHCPGDGLEPEEERLHQLINTYRAEQGLPPIPRSPSLDLLANRHVLDMAHNVGRLSHSWSHCPYDAADPRTYHCSAFAPQWLGTRYPGRAYENAHFNAGGATAQSALRGWQRSPTHRALILNLDNWQNNRWRAMGVGIYGPYAVLWLGEERDPETATVAALNPERASDPAEYRSRPRPRRSLNLRLPFLRIRIR